MDTNNLKSPRFDHHPAHPIDQLQNVMDDVEAFLTDWLQRVEQLSTAHSTPDSQVRSRMRELEQERIQWEAKRNRETKELHDKAEQLADAWLRLEQEQRRLLQIRDAHGLASRSGSSAKADRRAQSGAASETPESAQKPAPTQKPAPEQEPEPEQESSQDGPVHKVPAPSASRRPSPTPCQPACSSAILQFQQLRREIETCRQVNGRA